MIDLPQGARLQPCFILHQSGIPCSIWFEDALAHHGVPTVVFDLYLLVSNINVAASAMIKKGWILNQHQQTHFKIGNAVVQRTHCSLLPPPPSAADTGPNSKAPSLQDILSIPPDGLPPGPTATILLPAAEWNYTFSIPASLHGLDATTTFFIPPLPALLDSLISSLLDTPLEEIMLVDHLATLISYLYLYNSSVTKKGFAECLRVEHRGFHLDSIEGGAKGTLPFIRKQREVRDRLRIEMGVGKGGRGGVDHFRGDG